MGWTIGKDGRPVKTGPPVPEVTPRADVPTVTEFECGECDRTYKTESGLANHVESKH